MSPPLTVEVSDPIEPPGATGKVCYVLYAPESDVAPHFLNERKGVYVRTDEFSGRYEPRLANEDELRHLFDRRKLVLERRSKLLDRAQNRFRTFTQKRYGENKGREKIGPSLEVSVGPRFPAHLLCDHETLAALVKSTIFPWRTVGFPRFTEGVISQHESTIVLRPGSQFSILEATVWGMLYYATEIEAESSNRSGIHLYSFVGHLLAFLKHAAITLCGLGYRGPVVIDVALRSVCGVPWLHGGWRPTPGLLTTGGSELDDDIPLSIQTTTEALRDNLGETTMNLLQLVFFATNWPEVADSAPKLAELVGFGYTYNQWPPQNNR